jgi:hypothetical protein
MTGRCVMSKADDFRQYADEALRSANDTKSEKQKQALIDLARTWTQAALKADASTFYAKPPKYCTKHAAIALCDDAMPSDNAMQRRHEFGVCASSPLDGLEASLDRAREIAACDQCEAMSRCIEEARTYLMAIRALHQRALDEFSAAQGE